MKGKYILRKPCSECPYALGLIHMPKHGVHVFYSGDNGGHTAE